ncbi:MAG: hypothetical protein JST20_13775 [Bacteroidetes bacterium]|nr:hypothetical protein [Bacteroidota bacterium]
MKYWMAGLSVTAALMVGSCGGKIDEMRQAVQNVKELSKAGENIEKANEVNQARHEERRKRGDTLAMPYQDLQKYLPESISGYAPQEPTGSTMNMTGMSYSTAARRYTKPGADGSEESVEVTLIDYNASADLYTGMTALWGANFSMEDQNGYSRSFDAGVKDVAGWEHYDKQGKNSEITNALGGRFILTVKATGQSNNDMTKSIAKSMKLSDLAAK